MPRVSLTAALRADYQRLFEGCAVRPDRARAVDRLVDRLEAHRDRYERVSEAQGVPWGFVAAVHTLESSGDFGRHLHNGDPLRARTVQVPAGRPRRGSPPFSWEESASDALALKRLGTGTDWSLAGILYQLERYNGWGYRLYHPQVLSPYLWSFSAHYHSGKYVADGTWSDSAVSKQCGAATLLRRMAERGIVAFDDRPAPADDAAPLVPRYAMTKSRDATVVARVEALQRWLNGYPGFFLRVDGVPGERTSAAYRRVTGGNLPDDPRA